MRPLKPGGLALPWVAAEGSAAAAEACRRKPTPTRGCSLQGMAPTLSAVQQMSGIHEMIWYRCHNTTQCSGQWRSEGGAAARLLLCPPRLHAAPSGLWSCTASLNNSSCQMALTRSIRH